MQQHRHYSSLYTELLYSINQAKPVPCESFPELFFPEDIPEPELRHSATVLAKAMCDGCVIKEKCFEYALETDQRHGIWGGTSPDER
jgi:hypothetical protein